MKRFLVVVGVIGFLVSFGGVAFAADYVGSDQCFSCHEAQFNDWQASGHP